MSAFQLFRRMLPDRLRTTNFALAFIALVFGLTLSLSARAQTFTVLYAFHGNLDGVAPEGDLVRDLAGNIYGTTIDGGIGNGTVFKLDKNGREKVLHRFAGSDGASPWGGVVRDTAGNLYGTTESGGSAGWGVVFKVDAKGQETVLHSFTGGKDGADPFAPLILDAAGNLYGTTYYGGGGGCDDGFGKGCGVVFKVTPHGRETIIHHFALSSGGFNLNGGLLCGPGGVLYGSTVSSGFNHASGTVFRLSRQHKEKVLHQFISDTDGAIPRAGVIRDAAGDLYGTTQWGGHCINGSGCGVVYKVDPSGKETVLYRFSGKADGKGPTDRLVLDKAGNLYGTTWYGGDFNCNVNGCGVVFRLRLRDHRFTVLHTFTGKRDGSVPNAGLILDPAGNLYGVAQGGGDPKYSGGTVFRIKP